MPDVPPAARTRKVRVPRFGVTAAASLVSRCPKLRVFAVKSAGEGFVVDASFTFKNAPGGTE
jgi:hypothetical protein